MNAIAARIEFAKRPLLLAEFADVFGEANTYLQRVKVGEFVKRGWLIAIRKGGKRATARYAVGDTAWGAEVRPLRKPREHPPEVRAERLMRLSAYFQRQAKRLVGKNRKHALSGARGAREFADELLQESEGVAC